MNGLDENRIIDLMIRVLGQPKPPFSAIGDDVAHLPLNGQRLVAKCDMLVQGTDMPKGMTLRQAARKAVVMSVSDFACKGVQPTGALVALGLPRNIDEKGVRQLAEGFRDARNEYSLQMLGGDTNEAKELVIDCCMFGFTEQIASRAGAKRGNKVIVSGVFGYAASGLRILTKRLKAESAFRKKAVATVLEPSARLRLGLELAKAHLTTSSIDSSDGLALSLYQIAENSGVDIVINAFPGDGQVTHFAEVNDLDESDLVYYGGEEYEIVGTVEGGRVAEAEDLGRRCGCPVKVIGDVVEGRGKVFLRCGRRLVRLERRGWLHFADHIS